MSNLNVAIVLAAGEGTRMKSVSPKVLHEVCGLPILGHVLSTVKELKPQQSLVVIGHQKELVKQYINSEFPKVQTVLSNNRLILMSPASISRPICRLPADFRAGRFCLPGAL